MFAKVKVKKPTIEITLEVMKWSFLGLYFFLEMFTIVSCIQHSKQSREPIKLMTINADQRDGHH